MTRLGRPEETIRLNEQAMRFRRAIRSSLNWQFDIGVAHLFLEDDDQALSWILRARASKSASRDSSRLRSPFIYFDAG